MRIFHNNPALTPDSNPDSSVTTPWALSTSCHLVEQCQLRSHGREASASQGHRGTGERRGWRRQQCCVWIKRWDERHISLWDLGYNSHDQPLQASQSCARVCHTSLRGTPSSLLRNLKTMLSSLYVPLIIPPKCMEHFHCVKHCFKYREKVK